MRRIRGKTASHALGVGHALCGSRRHGDDRRGKEGEDSEADEGQHFRVGVMLKSVGIRKNVGVGLKLSG